VRVKAVLAICLAMAQCLSWDAPAIYLCICRNGGGICLDAGPGTCRCAAARVASQADACCGHEYCDEHEQCPRSKPLPKHAEAVASLVGVASHDCQHIQLCWSQPPSLSTAVNPLDLRGSWSCVAVHAAVELHALFSACIADESSTAGQSFAVDPSRHINPANLRC
jgi:hypothetical protein